MAKAERAAFVILMFLLTVGLAYKYYRIKGEPAVVSSFSRRFKKSSSPAQADVQTAMKPKPAQEPAVPKVINVNLASVSDLAKLPYVGKPTAQRIADYRASQGLFKAKTDLLHVDGISISRYKKIEPYITLE